MNHTLAHTATEPQSERDAAWFEELDDAVEQGRAALLARQEPEGCWLRPMPAGARQRVWPVADTASALRALADAGEPGSSEECEVAVRWLLKHAARQVNLSETAAVLVALARAGYGIRAACGTLIHHSLNWLLDARQRDGGWSACDATVKREPSCPTVAARVLEALGHFGFRVGQPLISRAVNRLLELQADDGAWLDTPQVLLGLHAVGFDMASLPVRRAVRWLKDAQNEDGGWGEGDSTSTGTAWGMLGLLAAGEAASAEVRAGAELLVGTQHADGNWSEEGCVPLIALGSYTSAVGVPLPRFTRH